MKINNQNLQRKLRFCFIFFNKFKGSLICLLFMVVGGGYLLHTAYPDKLAITDAMFEAFAALCFEIIQEPPYPWYVQIFLYLAPVVGIYVIADSISTLSNIFLGNKRQLQEWWSMVAASYQNHVVVCGVGKVGYRIINELLRMGESVVGIEESGNSPLIQELLDKQVPIIIGSARLRSVLERANVAQAKAVMCVTSDDSTNLDCAFTVRELKPDIRLVVRIFDDTIAKKISTQFNLPALSTSYASAPAFIAQALQGEHVETNLNLYGHAARITSLLTTTEMEGKTIAELEQHLGIKVLGYKDAEKEDIFPAPTCKIKQGEQLLIIRLVNCR